VEAQLPMSYVLCPQGGGQAWGGLTPWSNDIRSKVETVWGAPTAMTTVSPIPPPATGADVASLGWDLRAASRRGRSMGSPKEFMQQLC
jgi:hypothetical protein